MTLKKTIGDYSERELLQALAERFADQNYRPGMTMSQMELAVRTAHGMENPAALRALGALVARMPLEKPTAKLCPKCGKRTPPKALERKRAIRTLAGTLTLTRNYHYCDRCKLGFYPIDRLLDVPEEGELTRELEKRVLDFAVNDVFGQGAERWNVHYEVPISENLLRRVAARIGAQCEGADQVKLQEALKPAPAPAETLVIVSDGSMLPIRDADESWKEAKVAAIYRHDAKTHSAIRGTARYVAVVGGLELYTPVLKEALQVERVHDVRNVVWLGDGAPYNWTLADQLAPDAIQVLDWFHAVQHAVGCGKVLLGEDSPYLSLWQRRAEELLANGDADDFIRELMDCMVQVQAKRRDKVDAIAAIDDLVGYYRKNAHRMRYRTFREGGFPIGSGMGESAHRHVLQVRLKRAGQRWALRNARRLGHLRAAYRTSGPQAFYGAIQRPIAKRLGHQRHSRDPNSAGAPCVEAGSNSAPPQTDRAPGDRDLGWPKELRLKTGESRGAERRTGLLA
jgi:hypothetical protein